MTDNQNTEAQMAETPETTTSVDSVVTLVDLQNVLVIMDLASSRGAFRGPELQPIGQLYNKINQFLQAALPPKTEDNASQDDANNGETA